ncbi:hypothetical protein DN745_02895 [Bradymonas sediminis]|uniref:Uncharacterized protein n=2 Tax=Bradymonas sediminis TaxID=1548548 RepID=A0A2Z4FHW8_9DELT|nr:hypothetical protein DN745_02895 [Bradymonas sediminis]
MKLGRFRINLAQVAFIERDAECLLFFNADGAQIFERRFETQRQADQVLRDLFGYEDIQLVTARYEGVDAGSKASAADAGAE